AGPSLVGAWGVYPFFLSDTIVVSDTNSGLYVLKDNSLASVNGQLEFSAARYSATEGENLTITVHRMNGAEGSVSAHIELVGLSADASDVVLNQQDLVWSDGDSEAQTVTIQIVPDGLDEGIEQFALR